MQYDKLKKIFCCLVLFCLAFKNVSYALQPFNLSTPGFFSHYSGHSDSENCSIIEIVADYVDMELDGEGKHVFLGKTDKQRACTLQLRTSQTTAECDLVHAYAATVTRTLLQLEAANRKFVVPAHHHFLFRLTPF